MRLIIFYVIACFLSVQSFSQTQINSFYVATWNMENLFDNIDDADKNDEEWLATSDKQWTNERLDSKIANMARVIRYMNDVNGPDILGVEEVEHQHLLDTLVSRHFCDKNYKIAYAESPDNRGIDCGLIYNGDKFEIINYETLEVNLPDNYPTRYILSVNLVLKFSSDTIHVFVNHWPSRRGGEDKSEINRIAAAEVLKTKTEKLFENNMNPYIFIMGDFNDEPDNKSLETVIGAKYYDCDSSNVLDDGKMFNLAYKLHKNGKGSYLYRGNWNMLDQLIVSKAVVQQNDLNYICNSFEIIQPDFMITRSGTYKGASIPSFGGSRYLGGYSDHFPVGANFIISEKAE